MTKTGIFRKFWPKSKLFENLTLIDSSRKFRKNRKLSELLTKIEIFTKIWPKPNLSKILLNRHFSKFSKILIKIEIIRTFDQNRNFWKFSNKSKILNNFDEKQIFSKIWTKFKFFENLTKIAIFRYFRINRKFWPKSKCDQNRNFSIDPNRNFRRNANFSKILTQIEIFRKFDRNRYFSKFSRNSSKILSKLEIFRKFDKNGDLAKIWLKWQFFEIFENFDQKSKFL